MKTTLYTKTGNKKSEIALPKIFSTPIREDIVQKFFELDKFIQPYSSDPKAGKKHSASGTISHKRHDWKGHYGRGISRLPRKTMWRRGTQFFWIGAEVSMARGGRKAHPPKGIGKEKKINKKEIKLAMNSAIASTADKNKIVKRYSTLENINNSPAVIESLPEKTKQLIESLKKIYTNNFNLILKKKSVRAGKGKSRGRKYKSNAGLLIITGKDEKAKFSGVDIRTTQTLTIKDLYPLGRITLFTQKAIEELNNSKKSQGENKK